MDMQKIEYILALFDGILQVALAYSLYSPHWLIICV